MCGGQYGYIMVSKFGLHQIATHSPICATKRKKEKMESKNDFTSTKTR